MMLINDKNLDQGIIMSIFNYINCPVCGKNLHRNERSLLCESGHTFDVAKSGYVNLLPPGKEKNARTGDEKNMVRARVDFLSKNYYAKISDSVAETLANELEAHDDTVVFADMGCGEGYHTCRIVEKLGRPAIALGFDASKYAAECASKLARSKGFLPKDGVGADFVSTAQAYFFPANLFHLPLKEHCLDAAVSMFAPIAGEETHRILKKGGILCVVSSGRDHLLELRKLIYDDVHISDSLPTAPDGFIERSRTSCKYNVQIESRDDIEALFVMTPFYYKTTEEGRNRLLSKDSLNITVDVNISVFEAK